MSKHTSSSSGRFRSHTSGSWLKRRIRNFRASRQAQKRFKQAIIIILAVLFAFIIGYFFIGPGLSDN